MYGSVQDVFNMSSGIFLFATIPYLTKDNAFQIEEIFVSACMWSDGVVFVVDTDQTIPCEGFGNSLNSHACVCGTIYIVFFTRDMIYANRIISPSLHRVQLVTKVSPLDPN